MIVNDTIINADCETVLSELQRQLAINKIPYLRKMKDSGRNIQVQCPYHGNGQERNPSAGIHKETGVFHCFACGESHSLPEVISFCFGYDDMFGQQGMKWLVRNFATVRKEERKDVEIDVERNISSNKNSILDNNNSNQSDYVDELELDSYRYYHNYWAKRGIVNEYIIELFDLGYDAETDCITFPIRDKDGNCLFIARRSIHGKHFNYPRDAEKPLYGLYECSRYWKGEYRVAEIYEERIRPWVDKVFVTESMIDCILLWQAGYYAVALNGTGSALQFEQLRKLPCRHLVLATDNDKAGQEAREKIRQNVTNKLITEIDFPSNRKDIGECTQDEIKNIEKWEVF